MNEKKKDTNKGTQLVLHKQGKRKGKERVQQRKRNAKWNELGRDSLLATTPNTSARHEKGRIGKGRIGKGRVGGC